MAYAEKRGKGPAPWRVKYKREDGSEDSQSGFETKKAALAWGNEQEAEIRRILRGDPVPEPQAEADDITVDAWADRWMEAQDVGISTTDNREYLLRRFIRPKWGPRLMRSLTTEEINAWEKGLPAKEHVRPRTARDARGLLCTMLGDAATARPRPLIPFNPALRQRNRGARTGRRLAVGAPRIWATPLEALLVAERAALLSGQDDDFTMLITIAYTGMRWGETVGLEREFLQPTLINVEWQLRELNGKFHRLPPKDDSYRSLNWEPRVPVDLPPFLAAMLAGQARAVAGRTCQCAEVHEGSGRYLFAGPDGGHHRRSGFARRFFRPAADGRYLPQNGRPGNLVIVDAATWLGIPVAAWPPALPDVSFEPPSGRGMPRLVNTNETGRCPDCGRSIVRRTDGGLIAHKASRAEGQERCPGSFGPPAQDPPLCAWLPVKTGLTPHGLRHSHKTWMVEDGIPEILAELRLGHEVPGMRGLYSHVSAKMRDELKAALQARWEESLRERAALNPQSAVPALDKLLAPIRDQLAEASRKRIKDGRGRGRKNLASQIPPNNGSDTVGDVA